MTEDIGHMSYETYKRILTNVPYSIKLNWRGEPLLHNDLVRFVRYAKEIGVHEISLNTNGLLLTPDLAEDLALEGLDWLIFSVDGATKRTYEAIRQGSDFETVVKNIMKASLRYWFKSCKTKIRVQICRQPLNEHEITQWRELFAPYADQLRIGKLFDPQGKHGTIQEVPNKPCPSFWQRIVVDWKGNIYPCPADYLGKCHLGNINDTTIEQAWHSGKFNLLRNIHAKYGRRYTPLCKVCTSYC